MPTRYRSDVGRRRWLVAGVGLAVAGVISIAVIRSESDEPEKSFCAGVNAVENFTGSSPAEVVRLFVKAHGGDPAKAHVTHRYGNSGDGTWDVLETGIDLDDEAISVDRDADGRSTYAAACVFMPLRTDATSP